MHRLPPCPRQLNYRVVADMKKKGIANHLIAKYFNNLSKAVSESNSDLITSPPDICSTHAKEIAALLITDYLRRKNLHMTINTILNEGGLTNDGPCLSHIKELKINREMPPIPTLIRQRFVDETEEGWFEIDSQVTQTIGQHSSSIPGTTFSVSKYVNKLSEEQIPSELIGYARPRGPPLKSPPHKDNKLKEQKPKKNKKSKSHHKDAEDKEHDDFILDDFSIHTKSVNASVSTRLKQAYDLKSANSQASKLQLNDFLSIDF